MPRGTDRYDEARHQGRLWVPGGVGGIGRISEVYGYDASVGKAFWESPLNRSVAGRHYVEGTGSRQFNRTVMKIDGMTNGGGYTVKFTVISDIIGSVAFVRVGVQSDGGGTGAVYNSGNVGLGSVSTTFTASATTHYFTLFSNTASANIITFENVSIWLTSASTRDQQLVEGYFNWTIGSHRGLAASHPFKNRPPLIGD